MKMRILTLLCYLAAFAAGAAGVYYWMDRQQAAAQDAGEQIAVAIVGAPLQPPQEQAPSLRGPVYDAEMRDARLIRVSGQGRNVGHIIVPPRQDSGTGTAPRATGPAAAPWTAGTPAPAATGVPLEKMIGQMLIFGFKGTSPEQKWPQTIARQLDDGTIGGAIFLKTNFAGRSQGRRLMKFLHARIADNDLPPLFVVDQEGGQVQRLAANVGMKHWPSAARIGRGTVENARREYAEMADALADWGFNVNLGPVVDVNVNPRNPIIGRVGRSFSGDPSKVTDFARAFIEAHRARGILTALKHFPGHGSSRVDSHLGFTDISRTWQQQSELAPYRELIGSGAADMVMMGHLYLEQLAGGGEARYPATLSKAVVTGLLRNTLGYDGVIVSDDMEMGAIRQHFGSFEAAILAIKAGVDLLIVSNSVKGDAGLPERYIDAIASAARSDPELMARITQSYLRIVAMKQQLAAASGLDAGRSAS